MDITVGQKELVNALQLISGVSAKKSDVEIFKCALIEAQQDALVIIGTDAAAHTVRVTVNTTPRALGRMAVPVETLLPLVQRLPHGDVVIKSDNKTANIKAGSTVAKLSLVDSDYFPTVVSPSSVTATIQASLFRDMIERASPVITDVNIKAPGAHLELHEGRIRLVASNGPALFAVAQPIDYAGPKSTITLQTKTWSVLMRWMADEAKEQPVSICVDDNWAWFSTPTRSLHSRGNSNQYPNWRRLFESCEGSPTKREVLIQAESFKVALQRHAQFSHSAALKFSGSQLEIVSATPQGEVRDVIQTDGIAGDELSISVNTKQVVSVIGSLDAERIQVVVSSAKQPLLWRAPDNPDLVKGITAPVSHD